MIVSFILVFEFDDKKFKKNIQKQLNYLWDKIKKSSVNFSGSQ